jgi:hypothetical protein
VENGGNAGNCLHSIVEKLEQKALYSPQLSDLSTEGSLGAAAAQL